MLCIDALVLNVPISCDFAGKQSRATIEPMTRIGPDSSGVRFRDFTSEGSERNCPRPRRSCPAPSEG